MGLSEAADRSDLIWKRVKHLDHRTLSLSEIALNEQIRY